MAQEFKRVFIQPDLPSERDEFEGPFDRVADAVVETIRANNVGGKLIGLEGQWGGGKSTVLFRVFEELRKDKEFRVVNFDAWAHQGDPLRRSFLERIIDELEKPTPWVSMKKDPHTKLTRWQATIERLANRLSEERTTTVPEPNALGLCLGVSALLVPAGIAVLTATLQKESTLSDWLSQSAALSFGLTLSFAPLVVFLFLIVLRAGFRMVVRSWKKVSAWRQGNAPVDVWPLLEPGDFSPLQNNAISKSIGRTIRTAEPTSLEFEEEFSNLVKEGLERNKNRRLVIAVDNLDRVDAKDALTIWSTLQTFMQERNGDGFDHFARVTFVVPYDPEGLARLWDHQATVSESEQEDQPDVASNTRVAQSFIDKSFSIKFEVPPPVMSDWRNYLADKLSDALPDHTQAERDSVVTVFDLWRSISNDSITPRKLKLLVNQVCAVCRQWPTARDAEVGEFALASIAYYALLRRSPHLRDVARNLLSSKDKIPHNSIKHEVGERVIRDLSGLAHNVEGQHGIQLVIGEEVKNAFFTGNETMLQELEEQFGEGFWANLSKTTSRDLPTADAKSVCLAARGLRRVGWFDDEPTRQAKQSLDRLCARFTACDMLDGVSDESLDGLLAVVSLRPVSEIVESAIKTWQATLQANSSAEEDSGAKLRVSLTLRLIHFLSDHDHKSALVKPFDLNVDVDGWISATAQLKKETAEKETWKLFMPSSKTQLNEIGKAIHKVVADGTVNQSHRDCLHVSSVVFKNASWEGVCGKISDQLEAGQANEMDSVKELLNTLLLLHELGMAKAKDSLVKLASNGHLAHWMSEAESDSRIGGLVLIAQLIGDPTVSFASSDAAIQEGTKAIKTSLASENDDLIVAMSAWCELFSLYSLPYDVADALGEYPELLKATLNHCAQSPGEFPGFFAPRFIMHRWEELQDILSNERLVAVIESAVKHQDLCSDIQDSGYDRNKSGLYRYILEDTAIYPESFKIWCSEQLQLIDKEGWQSELANAGDSLHMLSWFNDGGKTIELPRMFSDALVSLAKKISISDDASTLESFTVSHATEWPMHLSEQVRIEYRSKLLRVANEVPVATTISDEFFNMFGTDLLEAAVHSTGENISPVLEVARQMATQATGSSLPWLHSLLEKLNGKGTAIADDSELRERISGLLGSNEEESDLYKVIESIAELMGIDIPSTQSDDVELDEGMPVDQNDDGDNSINGSQP